MVSPLRTPKALRTLATRDTSRCTSLKVNDEDTPICRPSQGQYLASKYSDLASLPTGQAGKPVLWPAGEAHLVALVDDGDVIAFGGNMTVNTVVAHVEPSTCAVTSHMQHTEQSVSSSSSKDPNRRTHCSFTRVQVVHHNNPAAVKNRRLGVIVRAKRDIKPVQGTGAHR